jgi:hypothetical protein
MGRLTRCVQERVFLSHCVGFPRHYTDETRRKDVTDD